MSNPLFCALDTFDLHLPTMITRDQLADLLMAISVEELARESGVATKTIYRLRHKANAPTLDTVQKLMDGISRMNKSRGRKTS